MIKRPVILNVNLQIQQMDGLILCQMKEPYAQENGEELVRLLNIEAPRSILPAAIAPVIQTAETGAVVADVPAPKRRGNPAFQKGKPPPYPRKTNG